MKARAGGGGTIRYFRCPRCLRWVSSTYSEVLRSDASFRSRPAGTDARRESDFQDVKARLERWLSAIDEQDPYRLLGVSPTDSEARVKARFRELALEAHPDRGGSAERMKALNLAYERIAQHRARCVGDVVPQPALAAAQ